MKRWTTRRTGAVLVMALVLLRDADAMSKTVEVDQAARPGAAEQ
jgi:hypothetical protein